MRSVNPGALDALAQAFGLGAQLGHTAIMQLDQDGRHPVDRSRVEQALEDSRTTATYPHLPS